MSHDEHMVQGGKYRIRFTFIWPYSTELHGKILDGLTKFNNIQSAYKVDIPNVAATMLPMDPLMGGRHFQPFALVVPFTKVSGNTPILVVVALILAALGTLAIAAAVSSKQFEKYTRTAADAATSLVPLGLLAVAGLFLLRR